MATRNSGNSTFSVLGSDISVKGDISASSDLHIDGSVEGDIACTALVQGESSVIEGGVEAESARLAGKVTGSIKARELVILKTARIDGDVHYDALTIEQGAQVEGRFSPRVEKRVAKESGEARPSEPSLTLAS
ncbi:polymer-forming cytoskeletal protein [Qipengyuania sp. MTN3-11]|uniref:bactofilin family protein n=1 Tax=Qipengyuania sp. MTN3-11 TaxID=3056557 RepID=UPI0036F20B1D